jgi:LytS/YehU family sensor histidine kinase
LARKKSSETPDAIMKLSKLLRFMLYETAKPLINVGDEIRMLENYIDLEKMRYNSKLTIAFSKDVDSEQQLVSPLLLLPFVENAFKHGAGESRFASYIHLDIQLKNGILKFRIENTKEDNSNDHPGTNIGLNNVKRQLELLYTEYDIQIQNEASVFTVTLTINLESYAKNNLSHS